MIAPLVKGGGGGQGGRLGVVVTDSSYVMSLLFLFCFKVLSKYIHLIGLGWSYGETK